MGAPVGNTNSVKKHRLVTDCLKRELTQRPQEVLAIVNKAIEQARDGDAVARAWITDRTDGKAPQPLTGGDEEDNPIRTVSEVLLRAIDAANDRPT